MGAGYWYSVTNAYRPVTHNVNDIASMYANRIAGQSLVTGEHDGGHEGDESRRFHGNCHLRPGSWRWRSRGFAPDRRAIRVRGLAWCERLLCHKSDPAGAKGEPLTLLEE
jgi:hypothetical protein